MIQTNPEINNIMEILKKEKFKVLICTVHEKLKENLIILEKIKKVFKDIKIILITELDHLKIERESLCLVADALLEKPFNLKDLIEYLYRFDAGC